MRQKILLVEDEQSIRDMYVFKLNGSDYDVKIAENGKVGLHLASEWHPDLILLDIMMPVMNGGVMLEKLRAEEWGASIRVIVLTNLSKSEAPTVLRFLNVDRYIVKAHSTPKEVIKVIQDILD